MLLQMLVGALFLEVFKIRLDKDLHSLIWIQHWPLFEQEVGVMTSWGAFQPEQFCDDFNLGIATLELISREEILPKRKRRGKQASVVSSEGRLTTRRMEGGAHVLIY